MKQHELSLRPYPWYSAGRIKSRTDFRRFQDNSVIRRRFKSKFNCFGGGGGGLRANPNLKRLPYQVVMRLGRVGKNSRDLRKLTFAYLTHVPWRRNIKVGGGSPGPR